MRAGLVNRLGSIIYLGTSMALLSSSCTTRWIATGLGCAWDICNMDRSAAQADRAFVCGIITQIDDRAVLLGPTSCAAKHFAAVA